MASLRLSWTMEDVVLMPLSQHGQRPREWNIAISASFEWSDCQTPSFGIRMKQRRASASKIALADLAFLLASLGFRVYPNHRV